MDQSKALAERRKIRKTLTVACLKERLSAYRKLKELQQHVKRKGQELEEKQSSQIPEKQKSKDNVEKENS
jgi:hypothetical protein